MWTRLFLEFRTHIFGSLILLLTNIHNNLPWDSVRPFRWLRIEVFFKVTSTSSCRIAILEDCWYLVVIGRIYIWNTFAYILVWMVEAWGSLYLLLQLILCITNTTNTTLTLTPKASQCVSKRWWVFFFFLFFTNFFFTLANWYHATTTYHINDTCSHCQLQFKMHSFRIMFGYHHQCGTTTATLMHPHNISTYSKGKERLREAGKGKGLSRETSNDRPKQRHTRRLRH